MSAIVKAIGPLVNIALLLLFMIIIFAIIGLEFYAGALNKTCYDIQAQIMANGKVFSCRHGCLVLFFKRFAGFFCWVVCV